MKIKYNKKDYIEGKVSHSVFFGQYVTDEIKNYVMSELLKKGFTKKILAEKLAEDENLNNIMPLKEWDTLSGHYFTFGGKIIIFDRHLFFDFIKSPDNSSADKICVIKEAIRQALSGKGVK